jgi:hypothetical protein
MIRPSTYLNVVIVALFATSIYAQNTITSAGGTVTTTAGTTSSGVRTNADPAYPDVSVTTGNSSTSAFHIFNFASTTDLFRVQANGSVGIGTASATERLDVNGGNVKITNANGPFNGMFYSGDTNWGFSIVHPGLPADDTQVRLNYVPDGGTNRKAGIYSTGSPSGYVLYADANVTPNVIVPSGNVGIGVTGPLQKLVVAGNMQLASGGYIYGNNTNQSLRLDNTGAYLYGWANNYVQVGGNVTRISTNPGVVMTILDTSVGIGSSSPTHRLEIGPYVSPVQFEDMPASNSMKLNVTGNGEIDVAGIQIGHMASPVIQSAGSSSLYLNQTTGGSVVIGTDNAHPADLHVSGTLSAATIYANYQDLAEWVPATGSLPAGTVVVLSDDIANTVKASIRAYDTGVAGVVSPTPGLLLGIAAPSKAKIATTGRVRVRVDATKSAIRLGDLLVTSDRPGMAMKSEPLDLAGVKLHRPGTLIGKALEPLASGEGEILVLLSLQ